MRERGLLIGGEEIKTGNLLEVKNPFTGNVVAAYHLAGREEVERAIELAAKSFLKYRNLPLYERKSILERTADLIEKRIDELAGIITEEAGKPIKYSLGEVKRAVVTFKTAAAETLRLGGEVIPLDVEPRAKGRMGIVKRFPIGPILGITPFNFPLNLTAHKAAPAIASGNTAILKPPPQAPGAVYALRDILVEAGLPEDYLSVVLAPNELAENMVRDVRIKLLSFTGSARVGWYLKSVAGRKRVLLELGGNAACIVHEDADLRRAAKLIAAGGMAFAGQVCISVQRVLVQEKIYGDFKNALIAELKELKVGDPADPEVVLGPMISESEAQRALSWIEEALEKGGKLLLGGKGEGQLIEPTLLENVPLDCRVWREEVFAPIIVLRPYGDFQEAIDLTNDSEYGLQAGLFTENSELIYRAFHEIEVGGLVVNDDPTFRVDPMPYGGTKGSGAGREGPRYAIEAMTEPRLLIYTPET